MTLTKTEENILKSIVVASEDDPDKPEFPSDDPRWPSTPTIEIEVPGFDNVHLKDESVNPTGTHKDRMAWEMVVTYRQLLLAKQEGRIDELPQMSIISSGSSANAIQDIFKKYHLPNLKVLVDYRIKAEIKDGLRKISCELYETDLSKKALSREDILSLTNNIGGIDITSDDSLGPFDVFYDWMSYDIINQEADYVFVPYGTGHLYENIVNVAVRESKSFLFHDKRLKTNSKSIRHCDFLGATTNNPNTKADKLYSPHLPFVHFDTAWIKSAISRDYIGSESSVYIIQEAYLGRALKVAADNKITCEPSGIAGLALMLQMADKLPKDKKMLIVNTGKTKYST
ncbi:MAG: pyridoxal-phosphate dependent enzyme [Parcubacteria group bacterium]|nr:pyridoxal-phosphate dependent enzyme [Parcubacteria group bacterium]